MMKLSFKYLAVIFTASTFFMAANSHAQLAILGITDGDLTGGNPKSIILQVAADVADLTLWGVGSANNGGGSDGEEFTFAAGNATAGDVIVIAGNLSSFDFYTNHFVQDFILISDGVANINGDDAIELFHNGTVVDTYGDIDTIGDGESWDYTDGFVSRTGGEPGAFDQANYESNVGAFDGLDEEEHIEHFLTAGFTRLPQTTADMKIVSITPDLANNSFTIEWTSIADRIYRLERSGDLVTWADAGLDPLQGQQGTTSATDTQVPLGATELYYRIVDTGTDVAP